MSTIRPGYCLNGSRAAGFMAEMGAIIADPDTDGTQLAIAASGMANASRAVAFCDAGACDIKGMLLVGKEDPGDACKVGEELDVVASDTTRRLERAGETLDAERTAEVCGLAAMALSEASVSDSDVQAFQDGPSTMAADRGIAINSSRSAQLKSAVLGCQACDFAGVMKPGQAGQPCPQIGKFDHLGVSG